MKLYESDVEKKKKNPKNAILILGIFIKHLTTGIKATV